ncbi:hypothetical protein [Allomuricauda sp. M10]|uniref:hypothetical protein n=1 Tax=Allomuricauda sp. M10 TaxID=2683292 RepID=UPI001D180FA6|nr:hypothetical protein [Muricauda sp. M10]
MRSASRILLNLIILAMLIIYKQDERILNKDSKYISEAKTLEELQEIQFKHRIEVGVRKQSLARLELNVGEQRTF